MSNKHDTGPKETPLDKEVAAIGLERYNKYVTQYVPLEQYAINQQIGPHQKVEQQQARNYANANYQQAFGQVENKLGVSAGGQGIKPGTGRFAGMLGGINLDRGKATGLGEVDTNLAGQNRLAGNLQGLLDIGQGKQSGAIRSLASAADVSDKQAIMDARASAAANLAIGNAIGTGVGLVGANYYTNQPSGLRGANNQWSSMTGNPNPNYPWNN